LAIDLSALAKAGDDGADQQLFRVGMNARVEAHAGGDDAGPDVGAVLDVDTAIGAEASRLSGAGEVQAGYAFRRVGVAGDRVDQAHIQHARRPGLPAGMGKVAQRAGDFNRPVRDASAAGGDAQRLQGYSGVRQIERGLQKSMHLRRLRSARAGRGSTREIQVARSDLDAIAFRISPPTAGVCRREIDHAHGDVAGGKVEWNVAILKIEGRGAILIVQVALLDHNQAGLQIEKPFGERLARPSGLARPRLVGRSVGVDDQVQPGLEDFELPQADARAPEEAQQAQPHAQAANLGVGRFTWSFKAVNDHSVRLGLEMQKIPVERGDFNAPAGRRLQLLHDLLADEVLKPGRTGQKIEAHEADGQKRRHTGHCEGKMAQEKAAQTAGARFADRRSGAWLRNRLKPGGFGRSRLRSVRLGSSGGAGRRGFGLAHAPPWPALEPASGVLYAGSSTSTLPCLRRFVSQLSNSTFTCCSSRISSMRGATLSSGGTASPGAYWGSSVLW
jgi:hypothetical protein